MSKQITINGEVNLEVEITASVGNSENAHDLKVTVRVQRDGKLVDLDITSALSKNETAMCLLSIEDEFRATENDKKNFGEAV